MRHGKPTRQKGFTLIELLVVVAIISVLMSILIPALGVARESAKLVTCASRMRNVAVWANQFADEYGSYPAHGIVQTPAVAARTPPIVTQADGNAWYDWRNLICDMLVNSGFTGTNNTYNINNGRFPISATQAKSSAYMYLNPNYFECTNEMTDNFDGTQFGRSRAFLINRMVSSSYDYNCGNAGARLPTDSSTAGQFVPWDFTRTSATTQTLQTYAGSSSANFGPYMTAAQIRSTTPKILIVDGNNGRNDPLVAWSIVPQFQTSAPKKVTGAPSSVNSSNNTIAYRHKVISSATGTVSTFGTGGGWAAHPAAQITGIANVAYTDTHVEAYSGKTAFIRSNVSGTPNVGAPLFGVGDAPTDTRSWWPQADY